jgi:uncharacterized protein (DUF362 family)
MKYHPYRLTRRDFMAIMGLTTAGLIIRKTGMAQPLKVLSGSNSGRYLTQVAATKHDNYEQAEITQKIQYLFEQLGGISDIVGPGDKVGIKINLTGGSGWANDPNLQGVDIRECAWTHPTVLQAVGELLIDLGVTPSDIYIVEGLWDDASYDNYGYLDVQQYLGAQMVNLNFAAPYPSFANISTGNDPFFYNSFILNQILADVDVFISIPKMKHHYKAGTTQSMKNLIGTVPLDFYQMPGNKGTRSALHDEGGPTSYHLPRSICDLNMARPVHLAVIDGIRNAVGGEGPWNPTFTPSVYNFLLAGKDPVATDSIATLIMGQDPELEQLETPDGLNCDNHLWLAHQKGMGTNVLSEIEIVGDGAGSILGVDEQGGIPGLTDSPRLYPNYPNPFRSYTSFKYYMPGDERVILEILEPSGKSIVTLEDGWKAKGEHVSGWSARNMPAGLYICRLTSNGRSVIRKIMIR